MAKKYKFNTKKYLIDSLDISIQTAKDQKKRMPNKKAFFDGQISAYKQTKFTIKTASFDDN